ncbi:o-succinylbenzoate synthase [Actinomycetospora sp. NBRC 106375]|uniref:o-succinylbenzoate synthase n=1 Tax=Actinomycetospora sp. NBRC 106375 TaxID=3032207 RepID=UPI0024A1448F|nr:o-succinylbenzoate synthase [Actinomycetospora sp. NBRC 106375]GLZ47577.1 o-succinylbenzoate synthase [Actinomycetospora sp. NBRC 106375]
MIDPGAVSSADVSAADVAVAALPLRTRFRGITVRELALVRGPAGWGEFCPFVEYDDAEAAAWWRCAREAAEVGWPAPVRDRVEVNVTVPAVDPEHAHRIVTEARSRTAKVKVAEKGPDAAQTMRDDLARVEAVRDALGPGGRVRVDANGGWDVDGAVAAVTALARAAGGLEYVEQPCATVEELAAVRRRVDVRVAADESIRRAEDPLRVARAEAADVAVLKVAPLGGVRAALRMAEVIGLPCVVSSAVESSVGLAAGLALAGALPELPFACGLGTADLLAADVVATPFHPVDGVLAVPPSPPAPDPSLLARYAAEPATRDWWTARLRRVQALAREDSAVPDRPT